MDAVQAKARAISGDLHCRWIIRRDMEDVSDIEALSFSHPWSEADFHRTLCERNCIGMIATAVREDDRPIGFMIYELLQHRLNLLNFAVDPARRRLGVGSFLMANLQNKLDLQRRRRIDVVVRETNLEAQLFFRACGFRAVEVIRNLYTADGVDEDAYQMSYLRGLPARKEGDGR